MFDRRKLFVFGAFVVMLFFMMTFAGGTPQNAPIATRLVNFVDGLTGDVISSQEIEVGGDASAPLSPNHDNYSFAGWYDENGTRITDFSNILSDRTIYARFNAVDPDTGEEVEVDNPNAPNVNPNPVVPGEEGEDTTTIPGDWETTYLGWTPEEIASVDFAVEKHDNRVTIKKQIVDSSTPDENFYFIVEGKNAENAEVGPIYVRANSDPRSEYAIGEVYLPYGTYTIREAVEGEKVLDIDGHVLLDFNDYYDFSSFEVRYNGNLSGTCIKTTDDKTTCTTLTFKVTPLNSLFEVIKTIDEETEKEIEEKIQVAGVEIIAKNKPTSVSIVKSTEVGRILSGSSFEYSINVYNWEDSKVKLPIVTDNLSDLNSAFTFDGTIIPTLTINTFISNNDKVETVTSNTPVVITECVMENAVVPCYIYNSVNKTITFKLPDLAVNSVAKITFGVATNAEHGTIIRNDVCVEAENIKADTVTDLKKICTYKENPVVEEPELDLVKSRKNTTSDDLNSSNEENTSGEVRPLDVLKYTLVINNSSKAPARSVIITDEVPVGTSLLIESLNYCNIRIPRNRNKEITCRIDNNIITWYVGTVTTSKDVSFSVRVINETTNDIINQGNASYLRNLDNVRDNKDGKGRTIASNIITDVVIRPNVNSTKDSEMDANTNTIEYFIAVSNTGTDYKRSVTVSDTIPAHTSLITHKDENGIDVIELDCLGATGNVSCVIGGTGEGVAGDTITWTINKLNKQTIENLTFKVQIDKTLTYSEEVVITNTLSTEDCKEGKCFTTDKVYTDLDVTVMSDTGTHVTLVLDVSYSMYDTVARIDNATIALRNFLHNIFCGSDYVTTGPTCDSTSGTNVIVSVYGFGSGFYDIQSPTYKTTNITKSTYWNSTTGDIYQDVKDGILRWKAIAGNQQNTNRNATNYFEGNFTWTFEALVAAKSKMAEKMSDNYDNVLVFLSDGEPQTVSTRTNGSTIYPNNNQNHIYGAPTSGTGSININSDVTITGSVPIYNDLYYASTKETAPIAYIPYNYTVTGGTANRSGFPFIRKVADEIKSMTNAKGKHPTVYTVGFLISGVGAPAAVTLMENIASKNPAGNPYYYSADLTTLNGIFQNLAATFGSNHHVMHIQDTSPYGEFVFEVVAPSATNGLKLDNGTKYVVTATIKDKAGIDPDIIYTINASNINLADDLCGITYYQGADSKWYIKWDVRRYTIDKTFEITMYAQ